MYYPTLLLFAFIVTFSSAFAQNDTPVDVDITVTQQVNDVWQVDYKFKQPIKKLWLGRKTPAHKHGWHLQSSYEIQDLNSVNNFISRKDEQPFDRLTVKLDTWSTLVTYTVQPFVDFKHGVTFYPFQLGIKAVIDSIDNLNPLNISLFINALPNTDVFTSKFGLVDTSNGEPLKVNLDTEIEPGFIIYFGSINKIVYNEQKSIAFIHHEESSNAFKRYLEETTSTLQTYLNEHVGARTTNPIMIAVGLQSMYGENLYDLMTSLELIPNTNRQAYIEKLKQLPPQQLFITAGNGLSNSDIQAHVLTNDDQKTLQLTEDNQTSFINFLSHEILHLYQAESEGPSDGWYEEGMANLASLVLSKRLFNVSNDFIIADINNSIQDAIANLSNSALLHTNENGFPSLNYTAGQLVLLAAQTAINGDIFDIDKYLYTHPQEGSMYEKTSHALRSLDATEEAIAAIKTFIETKHDDPLTALKNLFDATGVPYITENDSIKIHELTF